MDIPSTIRIKFHFIRELISDGNVQLQYRPTQDMIADMLTKGISSDQFTKLRSLAGVPSTIRIKFHFIRELISDGNVQLQYRPTQDMIADMLTKGISSDQFTKLRSLAGVREMPSCK